MSHQTLYSGRDCVLPFYPPATAPFPPPILTPWSSRDDNYTVLAFRLAYSVAMAQVYGQVARVETSGERSHNSFSNAGSACRRCRSSWPNHGYSLGRSRVCTYHLSELILRVDVMVCEVQDESKTSRPIPLLLLSRTMEIFQSIGMAGELQEASLR